MHFRRQVRFLVLTLGLVITASPAKASHKVYKKVVVGTVAFTNPKGKVAGSGILIDEKKRLVLTAYHVVNSLMTKDHTIHMIFPIWKNGSVVTSTFAYAAAFKKDRKDVAIEGDVIAVDPIKDLALVRLPKLPARTKAIPLATKAPDPGDTIHVVGNSTAGRGGLFGYSRGFVRNSFSYARSGYFYHALCHQSPSNKGDSGGPVVNDSGELVGMISQGTTGFLEREQVVDYSVHLKEIRAFLANEKTYKTPAALPVAFLEFEGTAVRHRQNDVFMFKVAKGEKAEVQLQGSQKSDLDLIIRSNWSPSPFVQLIDSKRDSEGAKFSFIKPSYCRILVPNYHTPDQQKRLAKQSLPTPVRFTTPNPYRLQVRLSESMPRSVLVVRTIGPKTTDKVRLRYPVDKKKARISIIGDGRADLNLVVRDVDGRKIVKSDTFSARETVTWRPRGKGEYTIEITHGGTSPLQSVYTLVTD